LESKLLSQELDQERKKGNGRVRESAQQQFGPAVPFTVSLPLLFALSLLPRTRPAQQVFEL